MTTKIICVILYVMCVLYATLQEGRNHVYFVHHRVSSAARSTWYLFLVAKNTYKNK